VCSAHNYEVLFTSININTVGLENKHELMLHRMAASSMNVICIFIMACSITKHIPEQYEKHSHM
jgi:hypothetical protein